MGVDYSADVATMRRTRSMTADVSLIYEFALGEEDRYAAILASILNAADAALDDSDDDFVIEEPDF
jgi:hypothetical protein